jgi:hypothetical protein
MSENKCLVDLDILLCNEILLMKSQRFDGVSRCIDREKNKFMVCQHTIKRFYEQTNKKLEETEKKTRNEKRTEQCEKVRDVCRCVR